MESARTGICCPQIRGALNWHAQKKCIEILSKTRTTSGMSTATLSTKGQVVIPNRFRKALHLQPGDKVSFALEGEKLVMQRDRPRRAKLVEIQGRKVLVAPAGAPPDEARGGQSLPVRFPMNHQDRPYSVKPRCESKAGRQAGKGRSREVSWAGSSARGPHPFRGDQTPGPSVG